MDVERLDTRHRRRGSTYILVIFAALMVSAIGLATLNLDRVQGQAGSDGNDFIEARSYARAGIEIGMLMIRNDPYWRTDLGNSPWVTNKAIGAGTFSLSAANPVSGDVTVGNNDPVVLTSTGMKGRAIYAKSMRLEVGPPVGSCFEVSMIAGTGLSITGGTLTGNQTVASDQNVSAGGGSVVSSNVEAVGNIGGSGYTKATATGVPLRTMPASATCFNSYLSNGTTINNTDLPLAQSLQFLSNTSFAANTSGWSAVGSSVLSISNSVSQSGNTSLLVSNRIVSSDTVAQNLSGPSLSRMAAASGNQFSISMPIYSATAGTAQAVLTLVTTNGTQTLATTPATVKASTWTNLAGNLTPSFSGVLTSATVSVNVSGTANFFLDNVSLTDQSYPGNTYVIDRALLSPASNPYGAGGTNASGIYVIQCNNSVVTISNSRIVGTVVFVNPAAGSGITGPVVWEPAVFNYPALMVQYTGGSSPFNIAPASGALSEAGLGVNLNPAGTPYPYVGGAANSTLTDSYPSQISGLIYSSANLTFSNYPSVFGVVIANGQITVSAASMSLSYGNVYLNNPPPGFTAGTITMKECYGTWQRVVH